MVRIHAAVLLLSLAAASGAVAQTRRYEVTVSPATAPEGYGKLSVDKAVIGTTPIRLWYNTSVEPDCSPHGQTGLTVVHPPEHGTVNISDEPFFYAFPTEGPRAACSQHKVAGHQAFYTANPGYAGHDRVVLEGSQPEGYVRRITVNIVVR